MNSNEEAMNVFSQFAVEKSTGRIMNKPFGDPISQEHTGEGYDVIEISFYDWQAKLQCFPCGYAPYLVNGEIEFHELQEFHDEIERQRMLHEIAQLKRYLADTDYIITKINEAMIEDSDSAAALKESYSAELAERKRARQRINEIESLLGVE